MTKVQYVVSTMNARLIHMYRYACLRELKSVDRRGASGVRLDMDKRAVEEFVNGTKKEKEQIEARFLRMVVAAAAARKRLA